MDYRPSYRSYDRAGPGSGQGPDAYGSAPPVDDPYDRTRKRGRSPSPSYYRDERRTSAYGDYPPADPWDRRPDYRDPSPYAARSSAYDNYRPSDPYDDRSERSRAAEWDRYYREREGRDSRDHDYRYDDRERYEARSRYDDAPADRDERPRYRDRERAYPSYDSHPRRDDHSAHGPDARAPFDPQSAPDPMQSDTLLPFRNYAQMIRAAHPSARDRSLDQPSTQELYDGYQAYKAAFNKKAIAAFFEQRKDEAWFKEKYSPAEPWLSARNERKRAARQGKKQAWLQELDDGKLDQINYDIQESESQDGSRNRANSYDGDSHHDNHRGGRRDDPINVTLLSRYGEPETLYAEQATIPACNHQILVKTYPADLPREKLEEVLKSKPGFRYLALGEPHAAKRWHRVGWAMYDSDIDMEETLNALQGKDIDGFTLNLAPCSKPTSSKLRTVPEYANSFHRLLTDLKHCKQLLERFEAEDREVLFRDQADTNSETKTWLETSGSEAILQRIKQIESDLVDEDLEREYEPEEDADKREYRRKWIKKQLDLHLDLLRTVYHCDYYISLFCEFEEELLRRSPRHGRKQPPPGALVEEPRESTNDESWARSVDQKTTLLLADDRTDLTDVGGKSIDAELMSAALPYIKEEDKEKHRCTVEANGAPQCGKLFKAAIFVQKHILNKHRVFIESTAQPILEEARFFNNYVRDPCRATSQLGANLKGDREGGPALAQRLDGNGGGQNGMFNSGGRMGMIRFGNASAIDSPRRAGNGGGGGPATPSLGMRLGGVVAAPMDSPTGTPIKPDPLPPAPKPLDPRAARQAPKSYQDLDGAAEGDVDLAY